MLFLAAAAATVFFATDPISATAIYTPSVCGATKQRCKADSDCPALCSTCRCLGVGVVNSDAPLSGDHPGTPCSHASPVHSNDLSQGFCTNFTRDHHAVSNSVSNISVGSRKH